MNKRFLRTIIGLCALVAAPLATAANVPYFGGPTSAYPYSGTYQADLNTLVGNINSNITTASTADFNNPRNLLDNGQMQVQQRGTAAQTCGTTTIPSSAYSADRWGCNVNVTSGAGSLQVVTTNLPTAMNFNAAELFYRTSGTLAQPQCVMQEIPTTSVIPLEGQQVTLSFYAYGLAAMLAEQTTLNVYLFTGTGTDQGLQSFTASPAITPAWTGISSALTAAVTLTSSYQKFTNTFLVPTTAKEAAVALCWTPTTGGSAGATDGFEFTGIQLEQGAQASTFEFLPKNLEVLNASRYYYQYADNLAATFTLPATCAETTANTTAACTFINPVPMRGTPTIAVATATSFGMTKVADGTAGACSTLAVTSSSATPNSWGATCALSETAAVGTMHRMIYANTGAANTITVSADY